VVTGTVDWQAADAMADAWIDAHHLERRGGCACGGCTCQPAEPMTSEAKARLRSTLLAMAADAMSGPGGLAGYLRTRLLQVPYNGISLPLDVGRTKDIPDHLRRAVILRDRHCAWPGGCDKPPAACECHHLAPRSQGSKTSLGNLKLLCDYTITRCSSTASGGNSSPTQTAAWTPSGRRARLYAATDPRPLARANRLYGRPGRSSVRLRAR